MARVRPAAFEVGGCAALRLLGREWRAGGGEAGGVGGRSPLAETLLEPPPSLHSAAAAPTPEARTEARAAAAAAAAAAAEEAERAGKPMGVADAALLRYDWASLPPAARKQYLGARAAAFERHVLSRAG
jgi:hypothetical protein